MTVSMFEAYLDELPTLRAERLLDAAHAAHPSEEWQRGLIQTIRRAVSEAAQAAGAQYVVNGVAVGAAGLKRFFRQMWGRRAVER